MEQSFENENTCDVFMNEAKNISWVFAKTWGKGKFSNKSV
jgi:hypothetical protein